MTEFSNKMMEALSFFTIQLKCHQRRKKTTIYMFVLSQFGKQRREKGKKKEEWKKRRKVVQDSWKQKRTKVRHTTAEI